MVKNWFDTASMSTPRDLYERIDATLLSISFKPKDEGVANFIIEAITAPDQNKPFRSLKRQWYGEKRYWSSRSKVQTRRATGMN